jgi:Ran GTPase-activating protein (RanGAP) involved in mRNA processing and transport
LSKRRRDAAEEQHFPKLSLKKSTLSAECVQALKEALRSVNLKQLKLFEVKDQNGRIIGSELLPCIKHFTHLWQLHITIETMNAKETQSFLDLLSKNTIKDLHLKCCSFTEELSNALATAFPQMPALQELSIGESSVTDDAAFGRLVHSARNLCLQVFELNGGYYGMTVTHGNQLLLSDAIEPMINLQRLWLEHLGEWSDESLCRLFRAIEAKKELRDLRLNGIGIGDSVMEKACTMISSLPNLEELDLRWNAITLTARGLAKLSECLKRKHKKLKELLISGNEGAEEENFMEMLKEACEEVKISC